ncbi:MAG TPA: beta-ketoacyl-ACP synthase II [Gaiellaceae bacterium]|nr:beta-ketoacyl-ACP synthase II [Gaiellaceae bacterium]HSJ93851.1 beta-ketoacyl-ACP synthase II [Gaiellaceae bacterium]
MGTIDNGRRVVVTGLGAVTPLGNDPETYWKNLTAGESGAGPITMFDTSEFPVKFACELKGFDPTEYIERRKARKMDRFAQMILAAARQAEADSGLDVAAETDRIGVSVATGIGGLQSFQDCAYTLKDRGADRVNPQSIPAIIPNMGAAWVSMELGTRGPLTSQCTACAASNMAVGEGMDAIRLGRADVVLAGGTEAGITEVGIAGFGAMRALSRRNDAPERASRPFDAGRDGFVMGEAGAIVVLESLEHAEARGAKVYAEIVGYGLSSDAQHVTEPDPTGRHPARAIQMALDSAGVSREEIDYVNAHGTSTPLGDASETRVIKLALGEEKAYATPISSTKGATGHCLGASGAIEAIACILAVRDGIVPPTINYEDPDPECDLDYIPNESRETDVRYALSNNFGFGGHNACLVIKRWDE